MSKDFEEQELELLKREQEQHDAKKITDILSDYVNYRKSNKAFVEAFKREHRTLQQSMFRMFLELIEEMASENYHTDGRNQDSKKLSQTLIKGFQLLKKQEYLEQGISEHRAEEYVSGDGAKLSKYLPFI